MDIDRELSQVEHHLKQVEDIRDRIKAAAEATQSLLGVCEAMGVKRIGIGARNDKLKDSSAHPFGYHGSIFVDGKEGSWPKAWAVAEAAGISCGCGNSGQHQVRGDHLNGVYVCKDGVWMKE